MRRALGQIAAALLRIGVCAAACCITAGSIAASAAEKIVLFAGGGDSMPPGQAITVRLEGPFAIGFDRSGNALVCEMTGQRVLKIDGHGLLSVLAGTGQKGHAGDGGPAKDAEFNAMHSLWVLPSGDLLVADTWNNRVRKIAAHSGAIETIAGTGEKGFSGDGGPATQAQFGSIYCIACDAQGKRLYLADLDNRRIRAVDLTSGSVTTVAGNGKSGAPDNGAKAAAAPLVDPRAVTVDSKGNVYILERNGNALRVIDGDGRIRTVVGTGKAGSAGDGGDARQAELSGPKHLCVDDQDRVLIADTENHAIRRYSPADGKIVRVAGTGRMGAAGLNGPPLEAQLNKPHGVYFDLAHGLFIVDSGNNRVLRIEK